MDFNAIGQTILVTVTDVGLKVVGAILLYIFGRWLIGVIIGLVQNALYKQKIDPTVVRYVGSIVGVLANIALVVSILGYFGVETTTFAALVAAAGVAIGAAWGGLLSNFAAGVFLIILRPFKVGDFICAGE